MVKCNMDIYVNFCNFVKDASIEDFKIVIKNLNVEH